MIVREEIIGDCRKRKSPNKWGFSNIRQIPSHRLFSLESGKRQ